MNSSYSAALSRSDLMELEAQLASALQRFLPFASYSLYFPTQHNTPEDPQWISRERTLLLPLRQHEAALGVCMLRGVEAKTVRRLLPSLPALTALCLDHLFLLKESRTDELTGLYRMRHLLERMAHDADMVRTRLSGASDNEDQTPLHKACMGLLVIRCTTHQSMALEHGHALADQLLAALAAALREALPDEVMAARSSEDEFTVLLPSATRNSCGKLAATLLESLDAVTLPHPLTKRQVRPWCLAGYAIYPQDMETTRLALPMPEQARHLLHKARLAVDVAQERQRLLPAEVDAAPQRSMAYARVLAHGGIVRELLPLERLLVNLGRQSGAREGQRFSVWGMRQGQAENKGEVVLTEVRETSSVADTLHLRDAAWPWEKGDTLVLAEERSNLSASKKTADVASSPGTAELLNHSDFLQRLARESEGRASFALALVRLAPMADPSSANTTADTMDHMLRLCRHAYSAPPPQPFDGHGQPETFTGRPLMGGRFGETSLVFFHPAANAQSLRALYVSIVEQADAEGLQVSVGLASYPYLQFHKGDILDCCHKALELALLLPPPQVGVMGSLALNISADQKYSKGDVFGAVEEYKQALLADARNAMAWNSLGVCMAALSRPGEARRYFLESLKCWKKELVAAQPHSEYAATLYNLGTVCQTLGETRSAARYFRLCVQADAEHYFAHIRLGQLAENGGKSKQARQHYELAAQLEDAGKGSGGLGRRHLARVALRQRKNAEARELLHETLLRNPQDATALRMLAELCLDSGEDPSMAEMLARKSVGLRPDHAPSWRLLGRCLRALGRENDACNAEDRAAAL